MNARRYGRLCLAIAIAVVGVKLLIGSRVAASAMMADDDENLNRAHYFIRGDFALTDYPFWRIAYGPLYPLAVAPSLLFGDPGVRLGAVFAINALLSAVAVLAGSLIVFRLTGVASALVPLCLAAYPPAFQLTYYALTENLLLPMLAVLGWLCVDFEETCRRPGRLALLVGLTALLPLVRVPGLAVVPALAALVWVHRRTLLARRAARLAAALAVALPPAAYLVVYRLGVGSDREAAYLAALAALAEPGRLLFAGRLAAGQVAYLFVSTGCCVLPVVVVVALQLRAARGDRRRAGWVNYLVYASVTGAGILFFALAHLSQRPLHDTELIYGRYDDPAGLLLLIGGLAGALALKPLTQVQRILLRVVAPVALALVLRWLVTARWVPINQAGLSILAAGPVPQAWGLAAAVLAALLHQLADRPRRYAPAALAFVLAFGALSDWVGMRYTIVRARKVAAAVQGSEWIAANVPPDGTIGYDGRLFDVPAPGVYPRRLSDVYRGMMFRTWPRRMVIVRSAEELARVDYLYSTLPPRPWPASAARVELEQVWSNGAYVLYRVASAQSVEAPG